MQNFSLHMHTAGFDGNNTEKEMLQKAQELGMSAIGFSNHFIVHPAIESAKMYAFAKRGGYAAIYSTSFAQAIAKFQKHYAKIDELNQNSPIKIYKGMEVDFFSYDGWRKGFEEALMALKPDYLIGAAHFVEYKNTLYNSHDLKNASRPMQNLLLHRYWQNLRAAAASKMFDFMAHLDLMKKVNLGLENNWLEEEEKTVAAIKKSGTKVELNTSFYGFEKDEPYPGRRIMAMLSSQQIPVLLSDDAHKAEQIGRHFAAATNLAQSYNLQFLPTPQSVMQKPQTINNNHNGIEL